MKATSSWNMEGGPWLIRGRMEGTLLPLQTPPSVPRSAAPPRGVIRRLGSALLPVGWVFWRVSFLRGYPAAAPFPDR